jgi:hypothetical protein
MKGFCCFIATAAQIALSPNTALARFSLKHGIMRQCQSTLQKDTVPPASNATNPSVITEATFFPSLLTHSEDAQVCNVVTATETPATALLSQLKARKVSPVPGTSGKVLSTNRNDDTLSYGIAECR